MLFVIQTLMALKSKQMTSWGKEATLATIDKMINDDSEILTIIYGEDADASEVEEITEAVEAKYPDVEVEVHEGNQPVYTYLLSVE